MDAALDRSAAGAETGQPWAAGARDVAAQFGVEPAKGLSGAEVADRLESLGPNVIATEPARSLLGSILTQLRETMILVLLAAAALTATTRDVADTAVILLVIAVNTTVGVIQERRALGAVAALRALAAPTARVRRDGTVMAVDTVGLVPGDVLLLAEGDVVGADARVLESDDLTVDEALLTGESLPARKSAAPVTADAPIAERAGVVHGGTLVVHGDGAAVVVATGAHSAIGQISTLLAHAEVPVTPLQRHLAGLGRGLSLIAVGACAFVGLLGLLRGEPWEIVVVTAISLAVAAIPESLPAVVALSLAAGASRMAGRGAIVRTLPAVETLGSITILASDKTGTLTSGQMAGVATWALGAGEHPLRSGPLPGPCLAGVLRGDAPGPMAVLEAAVLCSDATPGEPGGDMTEVALVSAAAGSGVDIDALRTAWPRTSTVPFDADRRDMSTRHSGPGGAFTITKGAPEAVLPAVAPGAGPEHARAVAEEWAGAGRRMLAVRVFRDGHSELLGLLALADPVRPEAAEAVRACREAGITVVMITGDHPGTATAVARQVGILDSGTSGDLVHARTDPSAKLDLIRGWREHDQVVAMTGDGVNDAPALRAADVGVAMGKRGTDVARGAADLILTDDSLATVVAAVAEGRRVFDNIRRFVRYGLAGGTAEIAVMLLGPALGMPLPLMPAQLLWVNLITHGLPGVAMGAEQGEPDLLRRPPRSPREGVLTRRTIVQLLVFAAAVTVSCLCVAAWARATGAPWQTMLFLTLAGGQLGLALTTRSDRIPFWRVPAGGNPMLLLAVASSAVLMLAGTYLPGLTTLLHTDPLGVGELAVTLLGAVFPAVVAQLMLTFRRAGLHV